MYDIFKMIVQFNIQAGCIVLAIIVLRLLLRKAPRSLICALWSLVAVRLIIPLRIKSIFSLTPDTEIAARTVGSFAAERISSAVWESPQTFLHTTDNMVIKEKTDTLWNILPRIAAYVWIAGVMIMLLYALISYLRLYRMTRKSIRTEDGSYLCDRIPSPFILGIFRPKIFLPSNVSEHDKPYILAHEKAHLKRLDHLWKPLGFLLLSVYWFNPLLWIAYILLCRDIETACDEKVIKELGFEAKKPYAIALINSAAPRKLISACPLAFGETSVKSRIKNVLNYKKPAFWIIIVAVVLSIAVAVCFLTSPVTKNRDDQGKDNDTYSEDALDSLTVSTDLPDDLDSLTVSTELPAIIYADDRYAYLNGDCGIVLYDCKNERVIGQIANSRLQSLGYIVPYSYATADGKRIIIRDYNDSVDKHLEFAPTTGEIIAMSSGEWDASDNLFGINSDSIFDFDDQDYIIRYDENGKNISERIYRNGNTEYRLSVPGWYIKNMELTVKNLKNNTEKTYKIFE